MTLDELRKQHEDSVAKINRSRFHKSKCPTCGQMVNNQAMGRKAHRNACKKRLGAK